VDGGDAAAARGARRDGSDARRGPRFGLRHQQKGKREDDDDDVTATSAWDPAVSDSRAARAWWRQRGRWAGRTWAGLGGGRVWLAAAQVVKKGFPNQDFFITYIQI
jgi:hypothetical protein